MSMCVHASKFGSKMGLGAWAPKIAFGSSKKLFLATTVQITKLSIISFSKSGPHYFQDLDELPEVLRPDNGNKTARDAAIGTLIKELDLFDLANLESDPLEFVRQLQAELESEKSPSNSKSEEKTSE